MILHNDRNSFEEIIIQTANYYNIDVSIIEKDYYKSDYEDITCNLLFEKVDYKTVKDSLTDIIDLFKYKN